MIEDVCIINGAWVAITDWYEPHQKPERVGWFEAQFFDCGWAYEWHVWWDGKRWLSAEFGCSLLDQKIAWRGLTEQTT